MKNNNSALSMGQKSKFPAMALGLSLAMAAPAMAAVTLSSGDTVTWTVADNNGFTQDTVEFEEITNVNITVNAGAFIRVAAMKIEDGDSGSSFLNIANGTLSLNQLVGGKDGPMVITIGDGGALRIDSAGTTFDPFADYGTDDAGSSINLSGTGEFVIQRVDNLVSIDPLDEAKIFGLGGLNLADGGVVRTDAGGYSTYTVAVPEPTSMSLLALGGLALLRRRRRA